MPHAGPHRHPLTVEEVRRLAGLASVSEQTFLRALAGVPVRSLGRSRIERALAEQGLSHLLPGQTAAAVPSAR